MLIRFLKIAAIGIIVMGTMVKAEEACLCFSLNQQGKITAYFAHDMKFYVEPNLFLGADIATVLPINDAAKQAIFEKFKEARQTAAIVSVDYELESKNYTAEITPLKDKNDDIRFFVKVIEVGKK